MLFNKNRAKENMTMDEENKMVELTDEQLKWVYGGIGENGGTPRSCYMATPFLGVGDTGGDVDDLADFGLGVACADCSFASSCFNPYLNRKGGGSCK